MLSAEYGMVDPDMVLEPYDRYLGSEPSNFRRSWSERTAKQVLKRLNEIDLQAVECMPAAPIWRTVCGNDWNRLGLWWWHPSKGSE